MPEKTDTDDALQAKIVHLAGSLEAAEKLGVPVVAVLDVAEGELLLGLRKRELQLKKART